MSSVSVVSALKNKICIESVTNFDLQPAKDDDNLRQGS